MLSIADRLKQSVEAALIAAFGQEMAGVDPLLVPTSNPKFGDYQANVAMSLAKQLGQPPRVVAEGILQQLDVAELCEPPTIAGPGFINLKLKVVALEQALSLMQGDRRLGIAPVGQPQKIIVDYPSPNIAKEMHVGHLRPAVIGECFARILEFLGHEVIKLSHVGDWGTPFGMLIAHLRTAYPEALTNPDLALGELSSFYREAKRRFDGDDDFREAARQSVVALQAGDAETLRAWQVVCELSKQSYRAIYDRLGVAPDIVDRGESFYNPYLGEVITGLRSAGLVVEDQGAQCVFLEGFSNKDGKPLPMIVQKSDGGYNYATTDLAAIRYRIEVDQVQRIVYTTDVGQTNHFIQVFQVARRAGWVPEGVELVHAPFGLVLGKDGKRMKTRDGDTVPLRTLLAEAIAHAKVDLQQRIADEAERTETAEFIEHAAEVIGIGAVKYADLSQNRNSNYIFDLDQMLALKGNTAPYMLYAYARIQSISRKGGVDLAAIADAITLEAEAELTLAKHLLQLETVLQAVAEDLMPNRLCQHLFELAQKYNVFFETCPVLKAEEPTRTSRLVLCDLTARSLKLGLNLLGIEVLDRM